VHARGTTNRTTKSRTATTTDAEARHDPDEPETYPQGLYVHGDDRAVVPCPYCRAEIDEESEQCPKCGMFHHEGRHAAWREVVGGGSC